MTSEQIVNEFFSRKGGAQMVEAPAQGGCKVICSQVIYITIKQAGWLAGVAQREGVARQDHHGRTVGMLPDGATWTIQFPCKNSKMQAASLQIVK